MSRHARAVDDNQEALVRNLRRLGVWVWVTSALGRGFPDLLCWHRGRFVLLEVKNPAQVPSARRLTEAEAAFFAGCPGEVRAVLTLEEALEALRVVPLGADGDTHEANCTNA